MTTFKEAFDGTGGTFGPVVTLLDTDIIPVSRDPHATIADAAGLSWAVLKENIQDLMNSTLVGGANISVTYNDLAGTLTIAYTGAAPPANTDALPEGATNLYFTNERAQDAVGSVVGVSLIYDDVTPRFERAALTGDATAAQNSNVLTIANDAVTYAKMQNVSATDRLLGRSTAGAGDVEEITCTAAGRALIDDADASAQRATLGLGTAATFNYEEGTFTPSLTAATPGTLSNSYTTRIGRYERLGRRVTGHIDINTNLTKGTASGGARIIDLPYSMSASASTQIFSAFPASSGGNINWGTLLSHFAAYAIASGSYIEFFAAGNGQTSAVISITGFPGGASTVLRLTLNYEA